jgi:hypothetical protein
MWEFSLFHKDQLFVRSCPIDYRDMKHGFAGVRRAGFVVGFLGQELSIVAMRHLG